MLLIPHAQTLTNTIADYYEHVPRQFQICGYDGAGIVEKVGSQCSLFGVGDNVFYSGSPIRQGSNAEYQLVDERSVGQKPQKLDFVEAAAMPLTCHSIRSVGGKAGD